MKNFIFIAIVFIFLTGCVSNDLQQPTIQAQIGQVLPITTPFLPTIKPHKAKVYCQFPDEDGKPIIMTGVEMCSGYGNDLMVDNTIDTMTFHTGEAIKNMGTLIKVYAVIDRFGATKSSGVDLDNSLFLKKLNENDRAAFVAKFFNSMGGAEFSRTPVKTGDVLYSNPVADFILDGVSSYKGRVVLVTTGKLKKEIPNSKTYAYFDMQTMTLLCLNLQAYIDEDAAGIMLAKSRNPGISDNMALSLYRGMMKKPGEKIEPVFLETRVETTIIQ